MPSPVFYKVAREQPIDRLRPIFTIWLHSVYAPSKGIKHVLLDKCSSTFLRFIVLIKMSLFEEVRPLPLSKSGRIRWPGFVNTIYHLSPAHWISLDIHISKW